MLRVMIMGTVCFLGVGIGAQEVH